MTLDQYIERELRRARSDAAPNAISLRFAQLHQQAERNQADEMEYQLLLGLMQSRWNWLQGGATAPRVE
jgi:hypothetical protein